MVSFWDPKSRVETVASGLRSLGMEKYLGSETVDKVATLSTVSGIVETACETGAEYCPTLYEKGTELIELSSHKAFFQGLEKAKNPEGRQELMEKGKELAAPYLEKIVAKKDKGKELAAPYIQKIVEKKEEGKELAAPYIQKFVAKKDEVLSDKRLAKALDGLKNLKEHPRETAAELKKVAVDLISYERLAEYREYIQSPTFQEDTLRLVKDDLPAVAKSAAMHGVTAVQEGASSLAAELSRSRDSLLVMLRAKLSDSKLVEPEHFDVQVAKLAELSGRVAAFAVDAAFFLPDGARDAIRRLSHANGVEHAGLVKTENSEADITAEAGPEVEPGADDAQVDAEPDPTAARKGEVQCEVETKPQVTVANAAEITGTAVLEPLPLTKQPSLEGDTDGF